MNLEETYQEYKRFHLGTTYYTYKEASLLAARGLDTNISKNNSIARLTKRIVFLKAYYESTRTL